MKTSFAARSRSPRRGSPAEHFEDDPSSYRRYTLAELSGVDTLRLICRRVTSDRERRAAVLEGVMLDLLRAGAFVAVDVSVLPVFLTSDVISVAASASDISCDGPCGRANAGRS